MSQQPILELELFDVWRIDFMESSLQFGDRLYIKQWTISQSGLKSTSV